MVKAEIPESESMIFGGGLYFLNSKPAYSENC